MADVPSAVAWVLATGASVSLSVVEAVERGREKSEVGEQGAEGRPGS